MAHEMARKNGTTPGAFNPIFVGLALLAAFVVAVDARDRPVLASVTYSITVFVTVSTTLARMPAFAQSLPSVPETALAAAEGSKPPAGPLPGTGSRDVRNLGASATIAGSLMSFSACRRPDAVSPVPG
jgi:hypothetical protein